MAGPQEMLAKLPGITGRSAEEWIAALRADGPAEGTHTQRREWLIEQGLGRNHAGAVLWWMKNGAALEAGGDELIDAQYAGPKAALRPVYEAPVESARALGDDVELGPRGTYVSLSRSRQFAIVQAGSRARVDLGLRLPGTEPTERLRDAGSFGSGGITHRVALGDPSEVDEDVRGWLRATYDARG